MYFSVLEAETSLPIVVVVIVVVVVVVNLVYVCRG